MSKSEGKISGNKPIISEEDMYVRTAGKDVPTLNVLLEKVDKGQGATNKTHYLTYVLKSPLISDLLVM